MEISPGFWKDRRVVVTGSTGFKGGWLCLWLTSMGAQVYGLGLEPNTLPSLFELADVNGAIHKNEIIDVRDFDRLSKFVSSASPEIVFHLAAQPLVRFSYAEPLETISTNVLGTANLLQCCRDVPSLRAIINITSDKCYENLEENRPFTENDPMGGKDIYSASKGAAEIISHAFAYSFFNSTNIHLANCRAGNVIGGGDWSDDRLVPDYFRAIEAEAPLVIRSPNATRPWQHVLEPLAGYLVLAQSLHGEGGEKYTGGWNFGPQPDSNKTVQWIVDYLVSKNGGHVIYNNDPQPAESHFLSLSSEKALEHLNWKGRLSAATALDWTINWECDRKSGSDEKTLCLSQIAMYMNELGN